ncbi:MAG: hypothetical protein KGV50_05480 [Gammaproteobacteria bacterium]|nr:hypothetical protein [Gammaproteobacteria bacterium]
MSEVIFSELGKVTSDKFVIGGTTAKDSNDRIIYDKDNGDLYYDADGNGSTVAVKFASVTDDTDISYTQFIV